MLITLCYVYMWVRFHKCYSALIRTSLCKLKSRSLSFCCSLCTGSSGRASTGPPLCSPLPSEGDTVFLQLGNKTVYLTEPQACADISQWTVVESSAWVCPQVEKISFIIEAAGHRGGCDSPATAKRVLKWSDYCLPLAYSPSQPFRVVAQTSLENFSLLGVAFIEDRLHLDDGLVPSKIVPVRLLEPSPSAVLEKQSQPASKTSEWPCGPLAGPCAAEPLPASLAADHRLPLCHKGRFLGQEANRRLEERRGSAPVCSCQDLPGPVSDTEDRSLGTHHHMEGHGHHLHLSSCHECLELENSTILSVKYASVENIPDLPDDNSEVNSVGETEADHNVGGLFDHSRKPPNVLVYTAGSQERFQTVSRLLSECINMENNIIYHLLPQQVLTDPWAENTRLLVLAGGGTLDTPASGLLPHLPQQGWQGPGISFQPLSLRASVWRAGRGRKSRSAR
ncbi:hypothetical protein fugu_008772 [Takifugu bimaculatus]|uniref:Uncharacterized protein n=1 Tax=Takifugu bimaculatus TaxID=433685 RepID=A0A4Z2AWW5_9TELE|nr:hypothetical protein fugu_008772 [Takifugu bimaculatus]